MTIDAIEAKTGRNTSNEFPDPSPATPDGSRDNPAHDRELDCRKAAMFFAFFAFKLTKKQNAAQKSGNCAIVRGCSRKHSTNVGASYDPPFQICHREPCCKSIPLSLFSNPCSPFHDDPNSKTSTGGRSRAGRRRVVVSTRLRCGGRSTVVPSAPRKACGRILALALDHGSRNSIPTRAER
jgi:hypothetical protein